jgi:hypothetical protein
MIQLVVTISDSPEGVHINSHAEGEATRREGEVLRYLAEAIDKASALFEADWAAGKPTMISRLSVRRDEVRS